MIAVRDPRTEGCYCGAPPALVNPVRVYPHCEGKKVVMVREFRCQKCGAEIETKREVTA